MPTTVVLSRTVSDNAIVLRSEVTEGSQDVDYPIKASELSLPGSPAEISSDWLPGISPAAKEVAWLLLYVFRQAGHWGTATVVEMAMHMLADSHRPSERRVGFKHHTAVRGPALSIFRGASQELYEAGYVTRNGDYTMMGPTPTLVRAITG